LRIDCAFRRAHKIKDGRSAHSLDLEEFAFAVGGADANNDFLGS